MLDWRVLVGVGNVLLIAILIGLVIHYRDKTLSLTEANNSLEAQISSVLNDHTKYADMYMDVSNRLTVARILALDGTLRLENIVIESDTYSELNKWSRERIPEEVKDVLTEIQESLSGGSNAKE